MDAEHFFKFLAQVARNQMQGLFEHRTPFDGIERLAFLETAMKLLHQRALARANRAHQIKHLAALFSLERRGMKVADDLRKRFFDPEKFIVEKIEELDGLVFVQPFNMGIAVFMNVTNAGFHDCVIRPGMGELGDRRVGLDLFKIAEQISAPGTGLV